MANLSNSVKQFLTFAFWIAILAFPVTFIFVFAAPYVAPSLVEGMICPAGSHMSIHNFQVEYKPGTTSSGQGLVCTDANGNSVDRIDNGSNGFNWVGFLRIYVICFIPLFLLAGIFRLQSRLRSKKPEHGNKP
jgi:hypothetical protein